MTAEQRPELGTPRIFIDFDSTLFDTRAFVPVFFTAVGKCAGLTWEQIEDDVPKYRADARLGGYDYIAHMQSYGLEPDAMWQLLDDTMRTGHFLYEDAVPFVQNLYTDGFKPQILSFGETRFQEAKIVPTILSLAPQGLEFDVVFRKKGEHIAEVHAGERGVLVDDVAGQDLPEGFTEIHLDRKRMLAAPERMMGGFVVSNLEQARQVILSLN